ncbi:MAG TPA: P-loop NTPase fold protein [Allosphingosinicella sp.]
MVTTESLLFAIGENGMERDSTSPEAQLVVRLSALLRRKHELYDRLRDQLFYDPQVIEKYATTGGVSLTRNVGDLLELAAYQSAQPGRDAQPPITLGNLLWAFPPDGSVAADLLGQLDIGRDQIVEAILASGAEPEASNSPAEPGSGEPQDRAVGQKRKRPVQKKGLSERTAAAKHAPRNERVSTHVDEPAEIDQLGRRPFAQVLARRIREARDSGEELEPSAFIVHLHGPWGSGKSSVLNFLERELTGQEPKWIVVKFNAWRDQRLQPPWWTLITTIYAGTRSKLGWAAAPWLRARWLWWRVRADYLPFFAIIACVVGLLLIIRWLGSPIAPDATPGSAGAEGALDRFGQLLTLAATAVTIGGAIFFGSRSLAMGSQRAAQAYADLKSDPYRPIARLFNRLVKAVNRPIAVFVDDLDRCDGKYVVELLEGIQTLMRGAPVTYVIAADRKWICSSFEQRYSGFSTSIGEPGRPLGYLFLDKMFQISAGMPQPAAEVQSSYWERLLSGKPQDLAKAAERRAAAEVAADAQAQALTTPEALHELVARAEHSGDQPVIEAARAAAAKRITSSEMAADTEHRLQPFAPLLEPNPRAMKRLVNAYGMQQATLLLAGRSAPAEALARWTILELRWPLLADFLASRPNLVERLRAPLGENDLPETPPSLRGLFGDELVVAVLGPSRGRDRLSAAAIRSILGSAQRER